MQKLAHPYKPILILLGSSFCISSRATLLRMQHGNIIINEMNKNNTSAELSKPTFSIDFAANIKEMPTAHRSIGNSRKNSMISLNVIFLCTKYFNPYMTNNISIGSQISLILYKDKITFSINTIKFKYGTNIQKTNGPSTFAKKTPILLQTILII